MRNVHTNPVTMPEVQAALKRSIDSASWAMATDDAMALTYLKSFLEENPNMRIQFYEYLTRAQPPKKNVDPDVLAMTQLHLSEIARLYERAYQGGHAGHVVSVKYAGRSGLGSFMYDINSGSARSVRLYVRRCLGVPRGEVNEDNFTLRQKGSEPSLQHNEEPKGFLSFIKKFFGNA